MVKERNAHQDCPQSRYTWSFSRFPHPILTFHRISSRRKGTCEGNLPWRRSKARLGNDSRACYDAFSSVSLRSPRSNLSGAFQRDGKVADGRPGARWSRSVPHTSMRSPIFSHAYIKRARGIQNVQQRTSARSVVCTCKIFTATNRRINVRARHTRRRAKRCVPIILSAGVRNIILWSLRTRAWFHCEKLTSKPGPSQFQCDLPRLSVIRKTGPPPPSLKTEVKRRKWCPRISFKSRDTCYHRERA